MNIPREFDKLTHAQLIHFAKAGFDAYWDLVDRLQASKAINSTMQKISKDIIEMQKVINKQNQELYGKCRFGTYGLDGKFNDCLIGRTCSCEDCELFKNNKQLSYENNR